MTAITALVTVAAIGGGGGVPGFTYPAIAPYAGVINQTAREYNIDPHLIAAIVMRESAGKERARTKAGMALPGHPLWAVGLMQVVAKAPNGFEDRPKEDDLYDPGINITWGCKVLEWGAYHHVPELPDNQVITALYQYSGGSVWNGSAGNGLDRFKRHYLSHIKYWYKKLFGIDLDVSAPLIQKPKPPKPAQDPKVYHDPLTDILASVQDCANQMAETAAKMEHYLQQQQGGDV